jgi:hypothetical protein
MGKLIVFVVVVGAIAYAWHGGWIARWVNTTVDSAIDSTRGTQRAARTVRPADPVEEKK